MDAVDPPKFQYNEPGPQIPPVRIAVLVVVCWMYMAALVLPAVRGEPYSGENGEMFYGSSHTGAECLLVGWFPPFTLSWLANPLLVIAAVKFAKGGNTSAGLLSFIALVAAGNWVFVFPDDLEIGYYLWLVSMGTLFGAALVGRWMMLKGRG